MSGRFVGRQAELEHSARIVRAAEVLWITGPAGIGKSRLALEAIGARKATYLDGHFMATQAEALPYLAELFGAPPEAARAETIAAWLSAALAALAAQAEVLIVEDLHLAARSLANLFLRIFRRAPLGYPVLVIGRESWSTSELVGDRLHHLQLLELSKADTQLFARDYGRSAEDLPPAAIGHPLLMDLFFRDGSSSIDAWTDSLLGELGAHCALLMRLAVAHSPVQLRWAMQGYDEAALEALREKGIFQRRRGTFRPVEDAVRRMMEERGQREDLERELLAYLASRQVLSERDLARALQLAVRYAENATLVGLVERHAMASTLVQPALVSVLRNRQVPAKAKLDSFQALAEHISLITAEDLLEVHDSLIESADTLERRVAQTSFLRAAFISGHRRWPREAAIYLYQVLNCRLLPAAVKEQILHLWAFRAAHSRRRPEDLQQVLALLAQEGIDAPTLRAYRLLFAGIDLIYQYRLAEAIAMLRESAAAFTACGHPLHLEWVQRYLLALHYSNWQFAEFRALLSQIDSSSQDNHLRGDFRYLFFKAVDAWNQGDGDAFEQAHPRSFPAPTSHAHSLLPGPYLADYQSACFRVILDRARNGPISPEIVDLFADALDRMMATVPTTVAATCLAQHAWLAGDDRALARLRAALPTIGPVGEAHALLVGSFDGIVAELGDVDQMLGLLDRALLLREPLTTPYYVVMAAHLVNDWQLPVRLFVDRIRSHPRLADMPPRAGWVIEAAALALGAEPRPDRAPPEEVRHAVMAQVHGPPRAAAPVPVAADASAQALKQLIDCQWFEEVSVEAFARAHNLSRFALSRRFKALLGRSPRQYLQETRIHHAKRKLVETDWTVTDIAFECGFTDAPQLSRLFKEATGMTPIRYRETNRKMQA